jgi:hypothetical protein
MPVPEKPTGRRAHDLTYKDPEGAFRLQEFLNKPAYDAFLKSAFLLESKPIKSFDTSKAPGLDFYFQSAKEATEWHSPEQVHC